MPLLRNNYGDKAFFPLFFTSNQAEVEDAAIVHTVNPPFSLLSGDDSAKSGPLATL